MYFFVSIHSSGTDNPVSAPYQNKESCWVAMKTEATKKANAANQSGHVFTLKEDKTAGKIVLQNHSAGSPISEMKWVILDFSEKGSAEAAQKAEATLIDNGIDKKGASVIVQALGYLFPI